MKKYILDRFEENFAVLEKKEGGTIDIDVSLLKYAKVGDVIAEENGIYFVDEEATKERKRLMEEKSKKLFGRKQFKVDKMK